MCRTRCCIHTRNHWSQQPPLSKIGLSVRCKEPVYGTDYVHVGPATATTAYAHASQAPNRARIWFKPWTWNPGPDGCADARVSPCLVVEWNAHVIQPPQLHARATQSPRGKCMPACEYRTPAVGAVAAGSDGSDVPSVRRVRGRRGQRMPRGGVPLRHGPAILVVCHPRRAPHACAFTVEADTGEMRGGLNA